jgi:hypothetical protein
MSLRDRDRDSTIAFTSIYPVERKKLSRYGVRDNTVHKLCILKLFLIIITE